MFYIFCTVSSISSCSAIDAAYLREKPGEKHSGTDAVL